MLSFNTSRVRRFAALPIAMLLFAAAACDDDSSEPGDPIEWTADVAGVGTFDEVEGTATVLSTSSAFEAAIEIASAPADTSFVWRVATGTCTQPGTIVGTADRYPELETAANGSAEAEANVTAALNPSGSYIVRVTDESAATPVTVACGALNVED